MNGGDNIARVLRAHGVKFLFTLCGGHISPILKGAKDVGIRVIDVRHEATAVFAADAVARLTRHTRCCGGNGRSGRHEHDHGRQKCAARTIARRVAGRRGRDRIERPRRTAGHRSDGVVQAAREVGARRHARARSRAGTTTGVSDRAKSGVPGPVFVECPVDLLYDEAVIREWYAASTPQGNALPDRVVRAYLNRQARRIFAGSDADAPVDVSVAAIKALSPSPGVVARAARRIAKAERPVLVVGSQALVDASQADAVAAAVERIGMPVYLSGMARGLMGAVASLAPPASTAQGTARSRSRRTRRRAVGLQAGLRPQCAAQRVSDIGEPQSRRSQTQPPPDIGALADAGPFPACAG